MNEEQKEYINFHLNILKGALRKEKLCFAFAINKTDFNKSSLAIVDKDILLETGKVDGIQVSLEKLNEGLL